jgi:hypothetical protein
MAQGQRQAVKGRQECTILRQLGAAITVSERHCRGLELPIHPPRERRQGLAAPSQHLFGFGGLSLVKMTRSLADVGEGTVRTEKLKCGKRIHRLLVQSGARSGEPHIAQQPDVIGLQGGRQRQLRAV